MDYLVSEADLNYSQDCITVFRNSDLQHEQPNPTGQALICSLPDELLLSIIHLTTYEDEDPSIILTDLTDASRCLECHSLWDFKTPWHTKAIRSLSLVCHRISHVAQPLLYRQIDFKFPEMIVPPTRKAIMLYTTLRRNERLREHCRHLSIRIYDLWNRKKPEGSYDLVQNFARWFSNVRSLSFYGGFDREGNEPTWTLIKSMVKYMQNVEHVVISRELWGLHLGQIVEGLRFPRLRNLDIRGILESSMGGLVLDSKSYRTAPITQLSLQGYKESPSSTAHLITWPKSLTHFRVGSCYNNPHTMDLPMFTTWLLTHAETLRHVHIGCLTPCHNPQLFDASLFPNLESLWLSRYQVIPNIGNTIRWKPEDARLLGPKLCVFGLDFTNYDEHDERWSDFSAPEEAWLTNLAKAAEATNAVLKLIKIRFCPDYYASKEEDGYPWDRMDKVRDEVLRPSGRELVYYKPNIEKECWLARVRKGDFG